MRVEELEKMYQMEDNYWWFVGRRRLIRALVERFGAREAAIVDVGCGTGGTMDALRGLGELTGADISADALGFCRERSHRSLVQCRADYLPLRGDSFDVAVCCDVLEHLEDDAGGFAEIVRVLKPGAVMVISVPAYKWLWGEHDEALSHLRRYEKREVRALMKGNGMQEVKLTYAVSLLFPLAVALRLAGKLRKRTGPPQTQAQELPGLINRVFIGIQNVETFVIARWGFPWGASLIAVGRKPIPS